MSKVLFIGDMHLKINRFDLAKQFLTWINDVVVKTKPDLVVNLGDSFDTHAVIRSEIMTEFMQHVGEIVKICPYVYVVGNHDMFRPNDSKYHALKHLKGKIDSFTIVDESIDLYGMTFVPYVHDPEMFPRQTLPICVAHQTFKGADFGDIVTKDGVDASSISGAQLIVSGHIHKKQRLATGGPDVVYCGSPFSQSASDVNQIKGVSVIDTDTYAEKFVECPLPVWRGMKLTIDQSFSIDDLHEELMSALDNKNHWVVDITGPKTETLGYLASERGKTIIAGKDVKIKTTFTDKEKRQVRIEAVSLSTIVTQFIDKVYSGALDKQVLKERALEVHERLNASDGSGIIKSGE